MPLLPAPIPPNWSQPHVHLGQKMVAEKCKVKHLGHNNPQQQYLMTQNPGSHHILVHVQEERDLGVIVDSQLNTALPAEVDM